MCVFFSCVFFSLKMPPHFVVVGGGIAGLAAVYTLRKYGKDCTVTLVEAQDRLGGKENTLFMYTVL